jgi:tRNA (adenine22-N1)-methyltransferase
LPKNHTDIVGDERGGFMKTSRLGAILDLVPGDCGVVDIGTDHALLPIALVRRGQQGVIIGSDCRSGPLEAARSNLIESGCIDRVELHLGFGLEVVEGRSDVEAAVLAGFGGKNIVEILERSLPQARSLRLLILQPMRDGHHLRCWLADQEFCLIDEELVEEDGRIYEIIVVGQGSSNWDVDDLAEAMGAPRSLLVGLGPCLVKKKHPLLLSLLNGRKEEMMDVTENLQAKESERSRRRWQELSIQLGRLEKVIQWLSG